MNSKRQLRELGFYFCVLGDLLKIFLSPSANLSLLAKKKIHQRMSAKKPSKFFCNFQTILQLFFVPITFDSSSFKDLFFFANFSSFAVYRLW
jgi:hypothetical protein